MAKLSGKLSVLMPAYNEETIIYENALEAARQISPLADDYELLVIDEAAATAPKRRSSAPQPRIRRFAASATSPTRAKAVHCGKAQPTPRVTILLSVMPIWI